MKERGQLQFEAMVCFATFLAVLSLFIGSINNAGRQADQAMQGLEARAEAEQCCLAADSVYATGISELSLKTICTAKGSLAESEFNGNSKKARCLAEEIRLVQMNKKSFLEVKPSEHYR